MTLEELQNLEAHHRRAARCYEMSRSARNAAIRQALAEGWTHAKIADATGLTRSRIAQISASHNPAAR